MIFIIKATVIGQSLRLSYSLIVSDTIDYLTAEFIFKTPDWDGLEKWAHFRKDGVAIDIKLTDDKILASDSLNLSSGKWVVKLHGNILENGEVRQRITTEPGIIVVREFGGLEGEPFPDTSPTAVEDIYAQIDKLKKEIESDGSSGSSSQNGATFIPNVSEEGIISWENDKGLENPEPRNIKGLIGPKGDEGKSAYQVALDNNFVGSAEEWLNSLKGDPYTLTEEDRQSIADTVVVPKEIYVGDDEMPEEATVQIVLDSADEEQALKDDLKQYIDMELDKTKEEIVNDVLTSLPIYNGEVIE